MSKRSKQARQQRNSGLIYGIAAVVVILVVAGVFLVTQGNSGDNATAVSQAISPAAYQSQFATSDSTHLLLDVRTPDEFASGHIHGAVNIPVEELENRLSEVPNNGEPLVVYCRSGRRSAIATQILTDAGYTSIYDLGALNDWTAQGFPVE